MNEYKYTNRLLKMINETKTGAIIQIKDNINKKDFEYIVEIITYVKLWLILFAIIITKIILIKTVRIRKRIYTVHNDRVIRNHSETTTSQA